MKIYAHQDISLTPLRRKKIAVIGYGSQGRSQALNLRDSGCDVGVGLRPRSSSRLRVRSDGLESFSIPDVVNQSDIIMLLFPDEWHGETFHRFVQPHLTPSKIVGVAHSYSLVFKTLQVPKEVGVFLVAPKGPGGLVRENYLKGDGVPAAVCWRPTHLGPIALAYAKAIGCSRSCVFETSFKEEVISNLFSEQCVLPGGVIEIMKLGFDVLVKHGASPLMAYFECFYKFKLLADLLDKKGLSGLKGAISDTALYGYLSRGKRLGIPDVRQVMEGIYSEIKNGKFAKEWQRELTSGRKKYEKLLKTQKAHPIERVREVLS